MNRIDTATRCPRCRAQTNAEIYARQGRAFLRATCPQHGFWERPLANDELLYDDLRRFDRAKPTLPVDDFQSDWAPFASLATTIALEATLRCNLACPDCAINSLHAADTGADPSLKELLDRLPPRPRRGFAPNVLLTGGEPLLREDIHWLVAGVENKGYTARLKSNGKGLLDRRLLQELQKAGLRWVVLQFDGFTPKASLTFRGENLIEQKRRVITMLADFDINVHLAVPLQMGVNDQEMHEILRYALRMPNVRRVSIFPRSRREGDRPDEPGPLTDQTDAVRALEKSSGDEIERSDILEFKRLWQRLYFVTRHPAFRNRSCLAPFLVTLAGDKVVPLNRQISLRAMPRLLRQAQKLWRYDRAEYAANILPVTIEHFHHADAFDLRAAGNCHLVYATEHGFMPGCVYNGFFRDRPPAGC
ncbi:MAG TPA: radical SAM protein [bacterium]|nr:radical SAM protein [bacterium]